MPDEAITDTAIAQPLIVAAGLAAATLLEPADDVVFAGHSVGEFTAACLAGILDASDAMRLVTVRGREMAAASADPASGMAAVLGGDATEVLAAIERSGCVAANHNGAGQIVAAGTSEALAALAAGAPAGARVRPLAVAGAFHSRLMAGARTAVEAAAAEIIPSDSEAGVISNRDGQLVTSGAQLLAGSSTRSACRSGGTCAWRSLIAMNVTAVIELPPAGTLTAMLRRQVPAIETLALHSPNDIPAARQLIADHARQAVNT